MVINIATLNSRGGDSKIHHLIKFINTNKIDILMLQEIHNVKRENILQLEKETNSKAYVNPGTQNSRGVMTIVKENDTITNSKIKSQDQIGNHLVIDIEIDNKLYEIVNIYAPMDSNGRNNLFTEINDNTNKKENRIIAGDFNNIEDFNLDCIGGSRKNFEQNKADRKKLIEIKENNKYIDTFRQLYPNCRECTYSGISNYKSRLDRIYIHENTKQKLLNAKIIPCYFSDHDMYNISIQTNKEMNRIIWGRGFWKYNKKTLAKNENLNELKKIWEKHKLEKQKYSQITQWWEQGKKLLKEKCILLSKNEKKNIDFQKKNIENELNSKIKSLDPQSSKQVLELKKKLKEIEDRDIEGALIRTKVQWEREGEKCTKFFFNLEKRKGDEKSISELKTQDGMILNSKCTILKHTFNFYKNNFSSIATDNECNEILLNSIQKQLTSEQRAEQAGKFKINELEKVKKGMKSGKSPGNDGFTLEFYQQCWHFIKNDLLDVLNEISISSTLPLSMTQALITLIFKNKGDRMDLKNWRAISLVNTDYKFLTGLLANRLSPFLPILTNSDQACAINGRSIDDQLIYIYDMMNYIIRHNGKSMIVGLDLQAAFDKIDHRYLHKLLERMNIGHRIRNTLKCIYDNMYSAIIINGAKTPYFKLSRSIRQGDKVSMACFILAIEPLANIIRSDQRIHSIILPNTTPRTVSQYCDDTCIFTTDPDDLEYINVHMQVFEKGAGANFNVNKTEILLIGKWNNDQKNKIPPEYVRNNIRILGIWFGIDMEAINNNSIITKIENIIEFWKSIPLSFDGKRLIIMTKILPQLYHVIRIIGMNDTLKKRVQTLITDFIWFPKKMKMISYAILQNSIEHGGLNMPNLDNINKAILAERIPKVLNGFKIWRGQFIYRMGYSLRDTENSFASSRYAHTFEQTHVTTTIISTYREINALVKDWREENFTTIKNKLHKENMIGNLSKNRDFKNTWNEISKSTDNRRRKDICYLIAHRALPIATVLHKRGINTTIECRLCGREEETFKHLFMQCSRIQKSYIRIRTLIKNPGRTLSEEEIMYHEGRITMKKKEQNIIAAFKQSVWQTRAKLYYGEIKNIEIEDTLQYILSSKLTKT